MKDLYIRFADSQAYTATNRWFVISPSDYMTEIDQTDVCQVLLKRSSTDEWRLGLNFLNQYTTDFDQDNMRVSIVNYNNNKPWTSS